MESRESEAFCFICDLKINKAFKKINKAFGSIKICRVSFLVQAQRNLRGYFYVAMRLKIQRCGLFGVLLYFFVGVSFAAYTEVRTIRA